MKIRTYKKRLYGRVAAATSPATELDHAVRLARAAAYLDATRAQFLLDVAKATLLYKEVEAGVLAGPVVANRRWSDRDFGKREQHRDGLEHDIKVISSGPMGGIGNRLFRPNLSVK